MCGHSPNSQQLVPAVVTFRLPNPDGTRQQIEEAIRIETEIEELLNLSLRSGSQNFITSIFDDRLKAALSHPRKALMEIAKLDLFLKHLREIQEYDYEMYEDFQEEAHHINDESGYFGYRLEVDLASSLIRHEHDFEKRESPDFEINKQSESVFFEATSAWLPERKDRELDYKIKRAIRKKSKKEYCSNDTALFVDITNLLPNAELVERPLEREGIESAIEEQLQDSDYGSVVIWAFLGDFAKGRFGSYRLRIDSNTIHPELEQLLDESYPTGNEEVDEPYLPFSG